MPKADMELKLADCPEQITAIVIACMKKELNIRTTEERRD